jgi:septal ring factor EnvC (AmiA/AmiB activator)
MKNVVPIFLVIIVVILGVALYFIKTGDNTQIANLSSSLSDCSNRLDIVNAKVTVRDTQIYSLSNDLATASVAVGDISNQLVQAQATLDDQKSQVGKLNAQLTEANAQNEALNRSLLDATNQYNTLSTLQQATKASLETTNAALVQLQSDYGVLGQRLQEDVAQRLVLERRWRNPQMLSDQVDFMKNSPEETITPERIYAGLNVLVSSNGSVKVLSPE